MGGEEVERKGGRGTSGGRGGGGKEAEEYEKRKKRRVKGRGQEIGGLRVPP